MKISLTQKEVEFIVKTLDSNYHSLFDKDTKKEKLTISIIQKFIDSENRFDLANKLNAVDYKKFRIDINEKIILT